MKAGGDNHAISWDRRENVLETCREDQDLCVYKGSRRRRGNRFADSIQSSTTEVKDNRPFEIHFATSQHDMTPVSSFLSFRRKDSEISDGSEAIQIHA
jgi:hypothetical protein